MKSLKISKK